MDHPQSTPFNLNTPRRTAKQTENNGVDELSQNNLSVTIPPFSLDWANIVQRFESRFAEVYSTSKKAHFDCLPQEYKIVDGARTRWCPLLLVDGLLFILHHNHTEFPKRRAFCQQQVLFDCVLDELKSTHRELYFALKERSHEAVLNIVRHNLSCRNEDNSGEHSFPHRGPRRHRAEEDAFRTKTQEELCFNESLSLVDVFPSFTMKQSSLKWSSMRNVRNQALEDPPTKSKLKFQVITERLNQHPAFNSGLKMKDLFAVLVCKVLVFFGSDVLSFEDIRALKEKTTAGSQSQVQPVMYTRFQVPAVNTVEQSNSPYTLPSEEIRCVSAQSPQQVWVVTDSAGRQQVVQPMVLRNRQPNLAYGSSSAVNNESRVIPRVSPRPMLQSTPPRPQSELPTCPPSLIHPCRLLTAKDMARPRAVPRTDMQPTNLGFREVFQPISDEHAGFIVYPGMLHWSASENLNFDAAVFASEPQHVEKNEGVLMAEYGLHIPSPVFDCHDPAQDVCVSVVTSSSLSDCLPSKNGEDAHSLLKNSSRVSLDSAPMCLESEFGSEIDAI